MSQTMQALFQQGYDRERWLRYLRADVFPSFKPFSLPLPVADPHVEIFYHLGNAVTKDGKELGIYEIAVGANTQLARNRVQLRQMVAKALKSQALYGALAVYCDQSEQWRFSYISIEPYISDSGELGRKETSSKRYTYVLGQGAKIRTAISRFSALPQTPTLQDLSDAFSVEALNKEFYGKLHQWYRCAKPRVVFPNDEGVDQQAHTSTSLIRLLTRLLFVWFLKQKQLVNPGLFDRAALEQLIGWDEPSSYYKAILQNLFFATLNCKINKRRFRSGDFSESNRKKDYQVSNVYRYKSLFQDRDPKKIIAHFALTPFLNGGLFECLDRGTTKKEKTHYEQHKSVRNERLTIRIDGFSDRGDNPIKVPNELFFNKDERALGLIDLLDQYQFTIEESVSLDIEVALDPELMGLIFENLLADYNPETKDSARKSSGSFYTPRQIVSYMVDESVKAYLQPLFTSTDDTAAVKLTTLFSDLPPTNLFDQQQTEALINAIDAIRILDPAVGSGAFPMGMLQRLIALLEFLDPKNEQFKQRQIDKAEEIEDPESRAQAIKNIKAIFSDKNANNNYGRKLYLIENCIFGVDIQSIAIQIAKLRFFISLAIEQTPTENRKKNHGIRPLPNLETKFIVANSLIQLDKPSKNKQNELRNRKIIAKERELNNVRRRYFNAKTFKSKEKYRGEDEELRAEISALLIHDGWNDLNANKISSWNPYSQNTVANWFDPEWMFGVKEGFDIVIGNPPYIESRNKFFDNKLKNLYQKQINKDWIIDGKLITRGSDLLIYFYPLALKIINKNGIGCYIVQNSWLIADYGDKFKEFILRNGSFIRIVDSIEKHFKTPDINTVVTFFTSQTEKDLSYEIYDNQFNRRINKKVFKYDKLINTNHKLGFLQSSPDWFIDIIDNIKLTECNKYNIKIGQGLNISYDKILKTKIKETSAIMFKNNNFVFNSPDYYVCNSEITSNNRVKPDLILPRGIGRHFCSINLCDAYSFSYVEIYVSTKNNNWLTCLWVYLNSSLVWLYRELTGRKNLGGGMLKAEATDIKRLPMNFDFDFSSKAENIFDLYKNKKPLKTIDEIATKEHIEIDDIICKYFGIEKYTYQIRQELIKAIRTRETKATT